MTMLEFNHQQRRGQALRQIRVLNTFGPKRSDETLQKKREKIKLVLTAICWLISLSGFLYQSSDLFTQYFSGKTIVNNGVERLKSSKLPAITVCLPLFLSTDKFAKTYPDLHFGNDVNRILDTLYEKGVSLADMFNKLSIDIEDKIKATVTGYDEQGRTVEITENKTFRSILPARHPKLCFTFFSDLEQKYREFKTKINVLDVLFIFRDEWFHNVPREVAYIIHSPNIMPEYKEEQNILKNSQNPYFRVQYNEIHTHLLPSPYETNCKNYDFDGEPLIMRSDCIVKCVTERVLKECKLNCINPKNNFQFIREETDRQLLNYSICNEGKMDKATLDCVTTAQLEASSACDDVCPKNCYEIFYGQDKLGSPWHERPGDIHLQLSHSNPDQIIEHRPIMQWLDLVSSFCGLLGMWLGLSIIFLCEYFIKYI